MVSVHVYPQGHWAAFASRVASSCPKHFFVAITSLDSKTDPTDIAAVLSRFGLKSDSNVYPLQDFLKIDLFDESIFDGFDDIWFLSERPEVFEMPSFITYLVDDRVYVQLQHIDQWMARNRATIGVSSGDGVRVLDRDDGPSIGPLYIRPARNSD